MFDPVLAPIDVADPATATRVLEIQRAAYAVEAGLIGSVDIPPLQETLEHVMALDLDWLGAFDDERLVGLIAWRRSADSVEIDRLAVDPEFGRRGVGRRLVQALPQGDPTTVTTGAANHPARALYYSLGFVVVGTSNPTPEVEIVHFERRGA